MSVSDIDAKNERGFPRTAPLSCIERGNAHRPPLGLWDVANRAELSGRAAKHAAGNLEKVKQNRSHGAQTKLDSYRLIDL